MNKILMENRSALHLVFLLMLLGFLWGTSFPVAKYVMDAGVPPLHYAFYQSFGALIVLLVYKLILREPVFRKRHLSCIKYFLIVSFLGCMIPNINRFYLTPDVDSGLLALIINTTPLFIYPLALWFGEERFIGFRFLGVLMGVFGVFLIVFHQIHHFSFAIHPLLLLAFMTPFSYALSSIYITRTAKKVGDSSLYAIGMLFFSSLFILLFIYLSKQTIFMPIQFGALLGIGVEILLSSLGYIVLFTILKYFGSVSYSMTDSVVIVTSLTWGFIFFNEQISHREWIAIILILIGIILVTKSHMKAKGRQVESTRN